ncbi:MAG: hypothetical protein EBZ47_00730 [Chlamydiae bacterium]|nr:hypothetical protein [Chlamydiota bacterium]
MKKLLILSVFFSSLYTPYSIAGRKEKKKLITPPSHEQSVYRSLEPNSILQHLAFYELYPDTEEGKAALKTAWFLLCGEDEPLSGQLHLPTLDVYSLIGLVNKQSGELPVNMSEEQLAILEKAAKRLHNRTLEGIKSWSKEEVLKLSEDEIDLGRALLIYQFDKEADKEKKIRQYEASLDLMALQISAKLPKNPTADEMIEQINEFIFRQMRFRFPPHSIYAKDVDLYTFLPSVIDSRLGVCLGVSILYLCIAQRLGLELEIITPPGHIYLRLNDGHKILNIETTARGIHMPTETYLGINTQYLQKRTMKEVVGLAFFNQASVMSGRQDFATAVQLYETAIEFVPNDPFFKLLLGIHYLFLGKKKEGTSLLKPLNSITFEGSIGKETIPEDYLSGRCSVEAIKMIFMPVNETRESILKKQNELKTMLEKYPKFRAGLMQLAVTYLQLGRSQEAYNILLKYHQLDPSNPIVEYYLSIICLQRLDYVSAWIYFRSTEHILFQSHHQPKALKSLKSSLQRVSPCPL